MHPKLTITLLTAALSLSLASSAMAGPREDQLAHYAITAKAADPTFAGFSAVRGKALYVQAFTGGKPDTATCATCHGRDPRTPGRALTGKTIEPMAVSASPARYTDPAKVEKWFKRNCTEVMGRECTAREKGDWLSFMAGQ